jgi:hypothetical protein
VVYEMLARCVVVSEARVPLVVPLPAGCSASPRATAGALHSVGGAMPKQTSAHEVSAKRGS